MKKNWFVLFVGIISIAASAQERVINRATTVSGGVESNKITFNLGQPKLSTVIYNGKAYTEVKVDGLPSLSHPGLPRLPFYSFVVAAHANQIKVTHNLGTANTVKVTDLAPCPPEVLRCSAPALRFVDLVSSYAQNQAFYRIDYLGDFRGQPLHRVTLLPHFYDKAGTKLDFYSKAEYQIQLTGQATSNIRAVYRKHLNRVARAGAYDYLVMVAPDLKEGLQPWIDFKTQSQGLKFKVVEVSAQRDAAAIRAMIASEYAANRFLYALVIGDQKHIPNFSLKTTTTSSTPTDLPYFTMGGQADFIPDVLAGRLVASTATDVKNQLKKWMDYEKGAGRVAGWGHAVGIASNEGSSPSDEEYVREMEKAMTAKLNTQWVHLAQNDKATSNPKYFYYTLGGGAMWAVYLGHGSGTSWPSFGQQYSINDIKNLTNASAVKPVWIDVACQNGGLQKGYAGERLGNEVDSGGNPIGTAAYYGGTVNVTWDPPAILAQGITFRMIEEPNPILGIVIQLGHAYLAEKISDVKEIQSNQIWYHLQGDPALRLNLKARR